MPEQVIRRLTLRMAAGCEEAVPSEWLWHGRHVKLVDGTTVSMPDTEANQLEYPQHSAQEEGIGFPLVRMVVLFSLATGMLCDLAMGPYQGKETGEPALFRELFARLYRGRWLAELDIRAIKITLDMDVLRCKTPEMVRRELWTHLLAYNSIRRSILQSAQASGHWPRELSFTAAMQSIAASWAVAVLSNPCTFTILVDTHLANLAGHRVGHRPDRVEPRAIKRRPKPHRLLTKPRAEARLDLLAGAST